MQKDQLGLTSRCSKCKQDLPLSAFSRHSGTKSGYQSNCRVCARRPSARSPRVECRECSRVFYRVSQRGRPRIYCSAACRDIATWKLERSFSTSEKRNHAMGKRAKECPVCGKLFVRAWAIYCGESCKSMASRLRRYGITLGEYRRMADAQAGRCAACGERFDGETVRIDHDHQTGRVRGLLHHSCNVGLGHAQDDPGRLRKWIAYLESA